MRKLPKPRSLLIIAAILVGLYALIGFVVAPYVIKAYVLPAVAEQLKRPVVVREVEINPFALSVRLAGFEIQEPNHAPILGFEEFFVNLQAVSLIRQAYVFDEIRLVMPFASVRVLPSGKVNLLELVPPATEPKPAEVPQPPAGEGQKQNIPPVEIAVLTIVQGILEFRDESKPKPFALDIVPIQITLRNFSTRQGGENAYAFTAEIGKGEALAWEGTLSLDPLQSQGKLSLSGVKLRTLWQYVQDRFQFDVTDGVLNASGRYRVDQQAQPIDLVLTEGKIALSQMKLGEKGGTEPLVAIPSFVVDGIQLDLSKRAVTIESVQANDTRIRAWLNADGSVNYQTLFAPTTTDTPKAAEKSAPSSFPPATPRDSAPWSVLVKEVGLHNHAISFDDRSTKTPVQVAIEGLDFSVKEVRVPLKAPLTFGLSLKLNQTGKLDVRGDVGIEPLTAAVELTASQIGITPFQPYLDKFVQLDVAKGAIDMEGKVQYAQVHPKGPLLRYQGNMAIKNLSVVEGSVTQEFLSWRSLALNKVTVEVEPTSLKIGEIWLQEPSAHIVVQKDGSLNLSHLVVASDKGVAPPQESTSDAKEPVKKREPAIPISVETVKLVKASATFTDQSIEPNIETGLYDLTGTINGLSSKQIAKADVALAGKLDHVAPLKITGQINPLSEDAYTDLVVKFDNMDLTTASPYTGKYVGYPVAKGKLFLDLTYKISQKQLVAENKVLVDQLTFGTKTNSPDATSLPVPLAVGLLKDRKGRIDIDLPIRGDLNDPDFKYGRVLLNTLLNLMTKIVTSPFSALGSLVGGSGEELQYIEFVSGRTEISQSEGNKLTTLAKALEERPGLRLEITGGADPARDRAALASAKLRAQLRLMKQQESGKKDVAEIVVTPEDEARLIVDLYTKQFRAEAAKSNLPEVEPGKKEPSLDEMKQRLAASIPVEESELRLLAQRRAKEIRDVLVQQGKIAEDRVFQVEADATSSEGEKPRSRLALTGE